MVPSRRRWGACVQRTVIDMKHFDVFGSLYIMSPCCLSARASGSLKLEDDKALEAVKTAEDSAKLGFFQRAQLATAAAWSPDPKNPPLHLDLPMKDGVVQPDVPRYQAPELRSTQMGTCLPATFGRIMLPGTATECFVFPKQKLVSPNAKSFRVNKGRASHRLHQITANTNSKKIDSSCRNKVPLSNCGVATI